MTITELNGMIKSNKLSGAFFFYGEEQYLLEEKVKAMVKKLVTPGTEVFNYIRFDGKKAVAADIIAAIDQFPQMSEMKVITVKNTGFLGNATLTNFKMIKEAVKSLPSDTCLIFIEDSFDKKKLKNLSFIEESGGVLNFEYMTPAKLSVWIKGMFDKQNKTADDEDIKYIAELCGLSMSKISLECDKLINYTGEREKITRDDIDKVVDKSVEYQIYEMTNSMIAGNRKKAYEQLDFIFTTKEVRKNPLYVLNNMVIRVSETLMCKRLSREGLSADEIGNYFDFKKPAFAVRNMIDESRRFSEEFLKKMLLKGCAYDEDCKSGRATPRIAAEMYLAEFMAS